VAQRFRLRMDLEPGEYTLTLSAAEALPRPDVPGGWDQDIGGQRYVELKRAVKVAVLARPDKLVPYYGPSYLESELQREVLSGSETDAGSRLTARPGSPSAAG
jgi:hypothetical protein